MKTTSTTAQFLNVYSRSLLVISDNTVCSGAPDGAVITVLYVKLGLKFESVEFKGQNHTVCTPFIV